ncbi:hypothetical protein PX669_19415 (plasmid) [Acinetobacter soli]|nr:hypothetical protein PX669_19415 [Acinetobacter soli]
MSKQSLFSLGDSGKSFMVCGTPGTGKSIGEEFAKNNPNIVFVDVSEEERAARKEESKLKQEAEKNDYWPSKIPIGCIVRMTRELWSF